MCLGAKNKQWREANEEYNRERVRRYYQTDRGREIQRESEKRRRSDPEKRERRNLLARQRRAEAREAKPATPPKETRKDKAQSKTKTPMSTTDKFFSKVEMKSLFDCWLWTGGLKRGNGYGIFYVNRTPILAHRWSYEYHHGPIPEGLHIDHLCRTRNCVNPAHLEAVTPAENTRRIPGRGPATHCKRGHLFTEETTIKTANGRTCRICRDEYKRKKYVSTTRPLGRHQQLGHPGKSDDCPICRKEARLRHEEKKRLGLPIGSKHRTHCKNGHPYNNENTHINPKGWRTCKVCAKDKSRKQMPRGLAPYRISKKGYSKNQWRELKAKYNHTCLCCGKQEPEIKLTADHVIPRAQGGANDISNIQPLCGSCNFKKQNKFIDFRPQTS